MEWILIDIFVLNILDLIGIFGVVYILDDFDLVIWECWVDILGKGVFGMLLNVNMFVVGCIVDFWGILV